MKLYLLSLVFLLLFSANSYADSPKKIVFVSDQNPSGLMQVFSMDMDGSNSKQLTNMPTNCLRPRWSKDGKKVVFQTDDFRIFLISDVNSSDMPEPYFVFGGSYPDFFGTGDAIIFNSDHEYMNSIYVMKPTDPDAQLIAEEGYCNQQELSKDESKLVYSSFVNGNKCIFVSDLDDTTDSYLTQVSINGDANLEPDISDDGKNFVYASFNQNLKGTIYVNIDGEERALTKSLPSANQPKFSPDGETIAFVIIEGTNVNLHVMNLDGSNVTKIPATGGNIGLFEWVDNETIIYDAEVNDSYSIGVINIYSGDNELLAAGGINMHPDLLW